MGPIARTLAAVAVTATLAACGGTSEYVIVGTARAAGTDGTITVEEIEGGNHLVTIALQHLPPPERLGEGLTTYVVWIVPAEGQATKAGKLDYDPETREGRVMATTPEESFTVKVTAEEGPDVAEPGEVVVAQKQIGG